MKRIVIFLCSIGFCFSAWAETDRAIPVERLPQKAREFIAEHFSHTQISLATRDKELLETSYQVIFTDGSKIEFGSNGLWTEINCKYSRVPQSALPKAIADYVEAHYPQCVVREIEREKKSYEVKLDNGIELKFDQRFQLIGIDL